MSSASAFAIAINRGPYALSPAELRHLDHYGTMVASVTTPQVFSDWTQATHILRSLGIKEARKVAREAERALKTSEHFIQGKVAIWKTRM